MGVGEGEGAGVGAGVGEGFTSGEGEGEGVPAQSGVGATVQVHSLGSVMYLVSLSQPTTTRAARPASVTMESDLMGLISFLSSSSA